MSKPTMKYKIVSGYKPGTTTVILRPSITDRRKLDTAGLVGYAIKGGYVRGQSEDMTGVLSGFMQAIQNAALDGYDVSLAGWLRVFPQLQGTVNVDRTLNSDNTLKVNITALKELKGSIDNFSWENVDAFENVVKVERVFSPGSEPGIIVKGKGIYATGDNLTFNATRGDKIVATCEDQIATPVNITPTESDYGHILMPTQTAFDELENLSVVTFTFTMYADGAEKAPQVIEKNVVFRTAA